MLIAAGFAALGVGLTISLVSGLALIAAIPLTVAHSGVLVWRKRRPEAVLAAQGITALVFVLLGFPSVGLGLAVLAGVHGLGATRPGGGAWPVLAATIAVMAVVVTVSDARIDTVVGNSIGLVVAWWLGDLQRRTRERAERAEQDSESLALQAVADERLRIARELHDVVAHALSVIAVQAGNRTGRARPRRRRPPATALAQHRAREPHGLDEMRRLLAVLRADDGGEAGPRARAPGSTTSRRSSPRRSAAACRSRSASRATGVPLPAGAELAAYRIVQEALTNVRRHAAATPGRGAGRRGCPDAVEVEVLDDGGGARTPRASRAGHGLIGMRERAELYGGTRRSGRPARRRVPGQPRASPPGAGRDPGRGGRRPAAGAGRLRRARSTHADDLVLVGEAADGERAVDLARRGTPRRAAHGRPHAAPRRDRGDPAHHRPTPTSPTSGS